MYYIEVLRNWRILLRYVIVLAALYLLVASLSTLWRDHVGGDKTLYSVGGHAVLVAFVCLLFASILGLSLSRHLEHLDFALTKPLARARFAATVFGIDVIALSVLFLITALAVYAFHVAVGETHPLVLDAASWFGILLAFGVVLAWYSIVQAVSCDRDAAGWALAGVWVTALGLYFLTAANLGPGLHALIVALNFVNPISYFATVPSLATPGPSPSLVTHAIAIYLVAGVAAFIAMTRWQRVEA